MARTQTSKCLRLCIVPPSSFIRVSPPWIGEQSSTSFGLFTLPASCTRSCSAAAGKSLARAPVAPRLEGRAGPFVDPEPRSSSCTSRARCASATAAGASRRARAAPQLDGRAPARRHPDDAARGAHWNGLRVEEQQRIADVEATGPRAITEGQSRSWSGVSSTL
jgi:hypothetical protein